MFTPTILPRELPDAAADDHRVDVAHVGRWHDRPDGMVGRIEVDVVGPDHHDVGLFAGRQRSTLVEQASAGGAADGRAFEHRRAR